MDAIEIPTPYDPAIEDIQKKFAKLRGILDERETSILTRIRSLKEEYLKASHSKITTIEALLRHRGYVKENTRDNETMLKKVSGIDDEVSALQSELSERAELVSVSWGSEGLDGLCELVNKIGFEDSTAATASQEGDRYKRMVSPVFQGGRLGDGSSKANRQLESSREVMSGSSMSSSQRNWVGPDEEGKLKEQVLGLELDKQHLENALSERERTVEGFERELRMEKGKVRGLEGRIRQLETPVMDSNQDKGKAALIETLLAERNSLMEQNDALQKEKGELASLKDGVPMMRNWLESRDAHIKQLSITIEEKSEECAHFKRQYEQFRNAVEKFSELESKNEKLVQQLHDMSIECANLKNLSSAGGGRYNFDYPGYHPEARYPIPYPPRPSPAHGGHGGHGPMQGRDSGVPYS